MNKSILMIHSFIVFCSAAIISCKSMAEPQNINQLKKDLVQYHDSGKYLEEHTKASNDAYNFLVNELSTHYYSKPAIVLDIDETCLSNYKNISADNFSQNQTQIHQSILRANGEALPGCQKLYQYAKAHHVDVFFISGRTTDEKSATIQNLESAGFHHWAGLYLLNKGLTPNYKNIETFKIATRKMLTANGYDILLSMGDKPTDFSGGYTKATFKLPNPYY
jgi:predicted secreted acid phosphatase